MPWLGQVVHADHEAIEQTVTAEAGAAAVRADKTYAAASAVADTQIREAQAAATIARAEKSEEVP